MALCVGVTTAQTPKKYDHVVSLNLPSYIYYCNPPFDVPRAFKAEAKTQYYYDKNDNKVLDGPIKITGGYVKPERRSPGMSFGEYNSSITVTSNIVNNAMEGPINGTFTEYQENGDNKLESTITLAATFKNGVLDKNLSIKGNLKRNGKDGKWWMTFKADADSNLTSVDIKRSESNYMKITIDKEGLITGEISGNDKFKFGKSVLMDKFLRKTNEPCACEEEHKILLNKYAKGEYTEQDLMKAGYVLAKLMDIEPIPDMRIMRCFNLTKNDLAAFAEVSYPLYILKKTDILSYNQLVEMVNPTDGTFPMSWGFKYDDNQCSIVYDRGYYGGVTEFALKSDVEKLRVYTDSLAQQRCTYLVSFMLENVQKGVEAASVPNRMGPMNIYWPNEYGDLVKYKNITFKIDKCTINDNHCGCTVVALLEINKKSPNGPVSRRITFDAGLTNGGKAYSVEVKENVVVPSEWDTYRKEKAKVKKYIASILSNTSKYEAVSLKNFAMHSKTFNINAKETYEESIKALNKLNKAGKDFVKYMSVYAEIIKLHTQLATALKPAKCAAKAYNVYYNGIDLTWNKDSAQVNVDKVLERQKQLLAISKRPTLADDEKRVKKAKLTNLDDIIKAYNNK